MSIGGFFLKHIPGTPQFSEAHPTFARKVGGTLAAAAIPLGVGIAGQVDHWYNTVGGGTHVVTLKAEDMPPYIPLDTAQLNAGLARGAGQTAPLGLITDATGHPQEPVSIWLTMRPSMLPKLYQALEGKGWVKAEQESAAAVARTDFSIINGVTQLHNFIPFDERNSPVTTMYFNGQKMVAAYETNDDYHRGRDHIRFFVKAGPYAGTIRVGLSSTRDVVLKEDLKRQTAWHLIDTDIDKSSNMTTQVLLNTGLFDQLTIVKGVPTKADATYIARKFPKTTNQVRFLTQKGLKVSSASSSTPVG